MDKFDKVYTILQPKRPCPACGGIGGFSRFIEVPSGGTAVETIHQWVQCGLCFGTGVVPA